MENKLEMIKKLPKATTVLVLINVIIFFLLDFTGGTENQLFMLQHGAMYTPYITVKGEYYRLFTSMFLHFGLAHLANNMIVLFAMGRRIEKSIGTVRYIIVYMLAGLAGNVLSLYVDVIEGRQILSAGASGAIMGITGSLLFLVIINKGRFEDYSFRELAIYIALSIYSGVVNTGIDNEAHVGGLVTGFVVTALLVGIPRLIKKGKNLDVS